MTIKNLYPKARPHIIYNVINGRPELPAQALFSRASEATYVDRAGIIRTAGDDEPRFNYDPETGEFLGLMLEEERTNSFTYSNLEQTTSTVRPTGWSGWNPATFLTSQTLSPDGVSFGLFHGSVNQNGGGLRKDLTGLTAGGTYYLTFYAKGLTPGELTYFTNNNSEGTTTGTAAGSNNLAWFAATRAKFNCTNLSGTGATGGSTFALTTDWQRVGAVVEADSAGSARIIISNNVSDVGTGNEDEGGTWMIWEPQLEEGSFPTSIIPTSGSTVTREPDAFSLTTSSNFDNGFSLLLDSNTTTDDFIYKIKAGGSTIAELNNDNGTLDWVIDGTSAATSDPPQYPQIGAIQPGRVRTVSSFGAAGDGDQTNYLYTESLSFPTVAEPAVGADELEFGPGQTVKAVYVWDGQLSNTEAVSVIKGEYNVILNEPIQADTYSFVYDTDPTNVGEASITLPYIVPTVSMRVYWGDTTSDRYEPGVTPSHTYPYPGQYRIQIEADDGFDAVRLADVISTIQRVDQWAPQHRVGATGDGFTGSDLYKMLATQNDCALIPPFKYTGLTDLTQAFWNCQKAAVNNWDWIPTNLQSATKLGNAFRTVSRIAMSTAERGTFPQLQTGTALTIVADCFRYNNFTQFDQGNSGLPFSNTQNVTNWSGCFRDLANLTAIGSLDTSAATSISSMFSGCSSLAAMPFIATNNVTNFQNAWQSCSSLTSFPQIDTSSGTNFSEAWKSCSALTSFPQIDTSSGTNFNSAWYGCSSLTSFPQIDASSGTNFSSAWSGCSDLTSFPQIDTSSGTNFSSAWSYCRGLTSFPLIDISNCANLYAAWYQNNFLSSLPLLDTSNCTTFSYAWFFCSSLTNFPALDFSRATTFFSAWYSCVAMTAFPANMFDTTGTLESNAFDGAWLNGAITAQSIENILVSLDTNGASNVALGVGGGTNAAKTTWSTAAVTAYDNLIIKGWTNRL